MWPGRRPFRPASAGSAAVERMRELTLDGGLFRHPSAVNHLGAHFCGVSMIALFLTCPRPLARPRRCLPLPALRLPPDLAHITHRLETPAQGIHLLVLLPGALARRDAVSRAALRRMGLSVVPGAGALVAVPPLPGRDGGAGARLEGDAPGRWRASA